MKKLFGVAALGLAVWLVYATVAKADCTNYYAICTISAWSGWNCGNNCYATRTVTDSGCFGPGYNTDCVAVQIDTGMTGQCVFGNCQLIGTDTPVPGHQTVNCPPPGT